MTQIGLHIFFVIFAGGQALVEANRQLTKLPCYINKIFYVLWRLSMVLILIIFSSYLITKKVEKVLIFLF